MPALLSPQNGSTVEATPTFRWSAVPGCAYHLQVAAGADFQSPVIDAAGIAACAFTPPALPAGRWSSRVRAIRMTPVEHGEDEHLVPQDIEGPPEASAWTASWKLIRKGGEFQRGDSNADARTDISDAVAVLGHLFLGGKINDCADAADTNDDGKVDISDPVRLLGHLFLGAERPPDPFQACGTDPTEDDLDCASYPGCPSRRRAPPAGSRARPRLRLERAGIYGLGARRRRGP